MREFDYTRLDEQLFDREIVSLLSAIHEHKGKQSLYIEASSDVLKKCWKLLRSKALMHRMLLKEYTPVINV